MLLAALGMVWVPYTHGFRLTPGLVKLEVERGWRPLQTDPILDLDPSAQSSDAVHGVRGVGAAASEARRPSGSAVRRRCRQGAGWPRRSLAAAGLCQAVSLTHRQVCAPLT